MLDKEVFKQGIILISSNYSNFKGASTKEALNAWYDSLKDLSEEDFTKAVKIYVSTEEYPPTIAGIRKLASKNRVKDFSDAWGILTKSVTLYGIYRADEAMNWIKSQDETTYQVVKALGYRNYCISDETDFTYRANFRMMYEEKAESAKKYNALPGDLQKALQDITPSLKMPEEEIDLEKQKKVIELQKLVSVNV